MVCADGLCDYEARHPGLRLALRGFEAALHAQCPPSGVWCTPSRTTCAGCQPRCDSPPATGSYSRQSTSRQTWHSRTINAHPAQQAHSCLLLLPAAPTRTREVKRRHRRWGETRAKVSASDSWTRDTNNNDAAVRRCGGKAALKRKTTLPVYKQRKGSAPVRS